MKILVRLTLLFLCCTFCNLSLGQYRNVKFRHLDAVDGLSSNTCLSLFQDSDGYLWFGTINGLNKFDGYDFEVYKSVLNDSTSISNNRINAIAEDHKGNIWVGTNNGLNFFDKKTNRFFRIDLYRQISLANNPRKFINDLMFDEKTRILWVATNNGLVKINLANFENDLNELVFFYYLNDQSDRYSLDNNRVNSIIKDNTGLIWVVTNGQYLNRYNSEDDNFARILIENKNDYVLNHAPKLMFVDGDNDFWIGNDLSDMVLWKRDQNTFEHISFTENKVPVRDLYLNEDGLVWASTDGYGLFVLEKKGTKIVHNLVNKFSDPFSLPNNKPSKIYKDKDGVFWIGSYDKGVSKLDLSQNAFGHYYYQPDNPLGLNEEIVQSVMQDSKGRIWLGVYDGGLNLFDEKTETFKHLGQDLKGKNSLSSKKILYTFESKEGAIWVCTLDGGLNKYEPETNRFTQFLHEPSDINSIKQNSVWCGVEDSKGLLWLGMRTEGLSLYNPKTNKFYNHKNIKGKENTLASNFVFYLFIDSRQRLLVGTSLGLNYVDMNSLDGLSAESPIAFSEVKIKGIEGNLINHIIEDHDGNIWVATDSGIYHLDSNLNLLKSYTNEDGLPNDLVVGIEEDLNHNFWVTTKSGLSLFNPKTGQFKNFNVNDGLQGQEYQSKSIAKTNNGRILAGGLNGFNIFSPNEINVEAPAPLKSKITGFKLNNETVFVGDTVNRRVLLNEPLTKSQNLELNYDENNVSFEFLALHFENPEQVQYSYKLKGLENDFKTTGYNREVNYSNLEPGDYVFEVKSSLDGQWMNAEVAKVAFHILSPPWQTWWAYLIYFVIGALLFWLIIRYYTDKVQEAQAHELDQMKLQFFVNVSHEFRTPLTLILNPVEKILSSLYTHPETIKNSATSIQRSARRLLHLVNQLLDYRKMDAGMAPLQLESGDVVKFSKDIFNLFNGLASKKNITYSFHTKSSTITTLFDFDKLEKIVTNLISNAIKYTNPGGEIKVYINEIKAKENNTGFFFKKKESLDDCVEIKVKDTGIGLTSEQLKSIFARFYNLNTTNAGTGIGLNFTKALVEVHGGKIKVESQPRVGSTFVVQIPLNLKKKTEQVENVKNEYLINSIKAVEYDMLTTNEADNTELVTTLESDNREYSILIVEDNKELRQHLNDDLQDRFTVLEAKNGKEGLKMVKKHYPDLIISDVMMPTMDGFEMCRQLKNDFETCHIPILLLTARSLEDDRVDGYDSGADAYLSKPFVTSVLKARIRNLLEAKKRLRNRFAQIGGVFPSSEVTSNNMDELFLDKATKIILDHIDDIEFKQEHLLKELGLGRSQFYRKISAITGNNPSHFIRTIRLRYAADLLQKDSRSIKEVTYMSGFSSTAYFSKTFRELFNVTPTEYIERNRDFETTSSE